MSLKLSREEWELADGLPSRAELQAALTKLKSERDALLAVVRPFAELASRFDHLKDGTGVACVKVGDLRKARSAIEAANGDNK